MSLGRGFWVGPGVRIRVLWGQQSCQAEEQDIQACGLGNFRYLGNATPSATHWRSHEIPAQASAAHIQEHLSHCGITLGLTPSFVPVPCSHLSYLLEEADLASIVGVLGREPGQRDTRDTHACLTLVASQVSVTLTSLWEDVSPGDAGWRACSARQSCRTHQCPRGGRWDKGCILTAWRVGAPLGGRHSPPLPRRGGLPKVHFEAAAGGV